MTQEQNTTQTLADFTPEDKKAADAMCARIQESSAERDQQTSQWADPILFDGLNLPEIQANILPTWAGDFAEAVSMQTQTPPGMVVMPMLSAIATCVQKKVRVSPFTDDDYSEPVNIWTLVVQPPASRKTSVLDHIRAPLSEWEVSQSEALKARIHENKTEREVLDARIKILREKAAKAEDASERANILAEIAQLAGEMPAVLRAPRIWTSDATPETFRNLVANHGERMSVFSDEGGVFDIMAGLYSGGKANYDIFLQSHAGSSCRVDRQDLQIQLAAPASSFGLLIQPEVIQDFSSGSKKQFRGKGLLARFLYCLPKSNIGTRDSRKRHPIPTAVKARYHSEMHKLLNAPTGENPIMLRLSDTARESWLDFSQAIEGKQGEFGEYRSIQDWTGKLPGAALRLAALMHIAEYGLHATTISAGTLERALELVTMLIPHTRAAFDGMSLDQQTDDAQHVCQWLVQHEDGPLLDVRYGDIQKIGRFKNSKAARLKGALELLVQRNILSEPVASETGGAPAKLYTVNPSIYRENS